MALLAPFGFSEKFVKWSFITGASAMLENRIYMRDNGGGYIYPTLYTLLVGAPATFKTTTCDRMVYDLLMPLATEEEGPWFGPATCTPAQMVHIFRRHNNANVLNKFQSSPMFVYAPEFNTFYRDIGGGELTVDLLNFYDPKPPGASWTKETVKDGKLEVISPALTILGCTTMKNITDSKMLQISGTGIVSRFLFVHEPGRPYGCEDRPIITESIDLQELKSIFLKMRTLRGEMSVSAAADKALRIHSREERQWHRDNPHDTLYGHYMARRGTQLRKVVMILAALRGSKVIEEADVTLAGELLVEIEATMIAAFGAQVIYRDPSLAIKLLGRIPAHGISEGDLVRIFWSDGQALLHDADYVAALKSLEAGGYIVCELDKKSNQRILKKRS